MYVIFSVLTLKQQKTKAETMQFQSGPVGKTYLNYIVVFSVNESKVVERFF